LKSHFSLSVKLSCDERFTHAFTAFGCVFKDITLVGLNLGNYYENATAPVLNITNYELKLFSTIYWFLANNGWLKNVLQNFFFQLSHVSVSTRFDYVIYVDMDWYTVGFLRLPWVLIFDWVGGAFLQGDKKFAAQISLLLNS